MRHSVPAPLRPATRAALLSALAVAVLVASGCSWFRKDASAYAKTAENRPLEVPPDLDLPQTTGALVVPAGTSSALRSTTGARPGATVAATATTPGLGFNLALPRDAAYARVGQALEGVEGLQIASRAQLLGAYDVSYLGGNFLVRVTAVEAGTYVSAVDPRGLPADGEAPTRLMVALKAALGGN